MCPAGTAEAPAPAGGPSLELQLLYAGRVGAFGNSLCEVGEREFVALANSTQPSGSEAGGTPGGTCPEDCPLPYQPCPAGSSNSSACSGHGRCLAAQGACDCFLG